MEMSRLTRDGTAKPVSRDQILRRERGQGKNHYGSPRFCIDFKNTIYKFLVCETWLMPDIESHIDTVSGAKFIAVCDIKSAYWHMSIEKKD